MAESPAQFSIIIPAYNEENAIDDIIRRCLAARAGLAQGAGLSGVEIIVVDDGSSDATREKASRWPDVKLVVHPKNRGYGAALMTGFFAASGDLLGFLDADGTCDPAAFSILISALKRDNADMAVGARLHGSSQMPLVRVIGNRMYALLLGSLTGVRVSDTASGMRVFRRTLLPRLTPLPTGLHFTPAMTARVACMKAKLVEAAIPYSERVGHSKLSVAADGFRFLRVILGTVFAYFPMRVFGPLIGICALGSLFWAVGPIMFYARQGNIEQWMIYRLLTILTLTVCAVTFAAFGLIAQCASDITLKRPDSWYSRARTREIAGVCALVLGFMGVAINWPTLIEYATTGHITRHWAWVLVGALSVICATVLASAAIALGSMAHLPRAAERR